VTWRRNREQPGAAVSELTGARILVVEDEEAIAQGLKVNLELKGYAVEVVADGETALERAHEAVAGGAGAAYALIVLDVRLPDLDGFQVCQRLRAGNVFTPVLMLTARSQPDDVIFGLKLGADDYVTKPFDLAELLARVDGLLRRHAWAQRAGAGVGEGAETAADAEQPPRRLVFGDFWVDFDTWQAQTLNGVVELSRKEMAVMELFAARPKQVVSRRELLAEVWQLPHHPNTRVVDNVIVALRKHFEENSWRPRHIQTVRGVGYRFVP
jgi:DNA-binding response OmpR family regulator